MKSTQSESISPVFICDEMKINVARTMTQLELMGHEVSYFANASEGYAYLSDKINNGVVPRLVIVDMALLPGADEDTFPDEEIDEGQVTGIVFIEKMFELCASMGREDLTEALRMRTILYTRVNETYYLQKALEFSRERKIVFVRKRIEDDGEFWELIVKLMNDGSSQ